MGWVARGMMGDSRQMAFAMVQDTIVLAYYLIARHAAQGKDLDAFLRMMADAYKMLLSRVVRMRMSVDFPTRFGPSDNYSQCVWEIILKDEIRSGCTQLLRGPHG